MHSHNIIGWNPPMVIPLLANQDFLPMLILTTAVEVKAKTQSGP